MLQVSAGGGECENVSEQVGERKREPVNRYEKASQENKLLKMYSKHQKGKKKYAQDEYKRERKHESLRWVWGRE